MPGRVRPGNLPPIKTVGAEFLMGRFSRQRLGSHAAFVMLGKVCLV